MNILGHFFRRNRYATNDQRRTVRMLALSRCEYCGAFTSNEDGNVDHIIPWSRGGWTVIPNLAWCCQSCNAEKGGRTPQEAWPWRKDLRKGWPQSSKTVARSRYKRRR